MSSQTQSWSNHPNGTEPVYSRKLRLVKRVKPRPPKLPSIISHPGNSVIDRAQMKPSKTTRTSQKVKSNLEKQTLVPEVKNLQRQELVLSEGIEKAVSIFDLNPKRRTTFPLLQGDFCLKCYHASNSSPQRALSPGPERTWHVRVLGDLQRAVERDLFENGVSLERAYRELNYRIKRLTSVQNC
ncbi:uncharacterized protein LOC142350569 [Convolutriloba macropyga]|uniref:uncharacterized protein LOC142350569 n=1 Tax=Convolutriloba macropyga TaxID=536237 RepID=UPI003F51D9A2